ncbi:MAG: NAD-dependent malic enzyme [Clostridiaceae bacterium]|jgi:malate dehydrogenase (oxaloacetate-decarboxylating)|uniref:NAD(P)-dependent malic enzyme n=1 Tax=[Ruminococcus] lactaris TaxID=46228 RepID=UPI000E41FD24|nr:NAD-dependent malic enzyme [Clostridiaceae bacterium]RGD95659.1 NAD-dependent malic enzyme [Clostridiales bacterium AM23-16LB]RHO83952.1 NAD-dependent malic enzyme [Clostridiaceae bacterium AF42-6]RHP51957.1 NAD-dependent malic enzyme [Clostridiaceae bacterium AF31-3BH]RHQ21909.1 NAD-dependent malic enzyme [Clostridiaceae bacterium AF29-16BH]RHR42927.1 NAD-dependent malic enzyme [Clostridiaceae bacterium AF18-31LB]RHT85566.1 NAD-dependent malic enzyme [Clostridiaceae bacterium AM27-36LB]R
MDYAKESLRLHKEWKGKLEVVTRVPVANKDDLSLAYTPGVAQPCLEIQKNIDASYELTRRWNMCLVVTDGSAVLGLGDIGPEAGMPVMEGKCVLFKAFGDVDAFPLCIKSHDVDEIVNTIYLISGSFGGVNLEDISAPRCFEIEKKLKEKCDIPIFHDDQHGTAIITLAGLTNALKVVGKKKEEVHVVMNGAGAAAISIARLLLKAGIKNITLCDRKGAIYEGRPEGMNPVKDEMSKVTNLEHKAGSLADMLKGADVFIGVSAPGAVTVDMVKTMAKDAIIFACANPTPEIFPDDAKAGGAKVIATGRSDYPNQINNVLAFPGVFRGAFDVRAKDINDEMKIAAAEALAGLITDEELSPDYIIPKAFDKRVGPAVAKAVAEAAKKTGVARL